MRHLRDPCSWLLLGLLLSWMVMLLLMWREFWTLPAPEVLQRERMVRPPTMQSLRTSVVQSTAELGVLTLLLWPGRLWGVRLALSTLALPVYYVLSAPMALTSVEQVHRRWLAAVAVVLLVASVVGLVRGIVRALRP